MLPKGLWFWTSQWLCHLKRLQARCLSSVVVNSTTVGETRVKWIGRLTQKFSCQFSPCPSSVPATTSQTSCTGTAAGRVWAGNAVSWYLHSEKWLWQQYSWLFSWVSRWVRFLCTCSKCTNTRLLVLLFTVFLCWLLLTSAEWVQICVSDDDQTAMANVIPTVKI